MLQQHLPLFIQRIFTHGLKEKNTQMCSATYIIVQESTPEVLRHAQMVIESCVTKVKQGLDAVNVPFSFGMLDI